MRIPLQDIGAGEGPATKDAPIVSRRVAGTEWGEKVCAVHQVGPGFDATPILPGGLCPVPHWGYCFKGKLTMHYHDGVEEVIRAGDVFYMRPGHTFSTDKDAGENCELIEFSELADFIAMEKGMEQTKPDGESTND